MVRQRHQHRAELVGVEPVETRRYEVVARPAERHEALWTPHCPHTHTHSTIQYHLVNPCKGNYIVVWMCMNT